MFDNDERFLIWGKNIFLRNVVMCFNINSILLNYICIGNFRITLPLYIRNFNLIYDYFNFKKYKHFDIMRNIIMF